MVPRSAVSASCAPALARRQGRDPVHDGTYIVVGGAGRQHGEGLDGDNWVWSTRRGAPCQNGSITL